MGVVEAKNVLVLHPITYIMKKIHFSCTFLLLAVCFGCTKNELPDNDIDKIAGTYKGSTIRYTTITNFAPGGDTTVSATVDTLTLFYQVQQYNADTILLTSFHSLGNLMVVYTGNNLTINTNWGVQKVTFTPAEHKAEVYDSAMYVVNGGSTLHKSVTFFVGNK